MPNRPNDPRDPKGPGGPSRPSGPGSPGDPGEPDDPDYPRTSRDNYYNPQLDEWQLNNKVNTSQVPSWDGDGDTAIKYPVAINNLSKLGWKVVHQMGYILPQKWTGLALAWWNAIPEAQQETMRADIMEMVFGLRGFLLNLEWLEEHHPPLANSVLQLLLDAELRKHSLISMWNNYCDANDLRNGVKSEVSPANKPYRRFNHRSRPANHVTIEEVPDEGDSRTDAVEKSDEEDDESDESHLVNVIQGRKDRPKTPWPKGGTFKGKTFLKQDQKKSAIPPTHGNCYVCNSSYHYTWKCPLYREWDALTQANMIQMEVEQSVQELDTKEYYSIPLTPVDATLVRDL
ncbi:hypothetical protein C8J56DRAFT_1050356 [Mycena floridula]|nr:hypothetical protein C8J56DRAFT_1050356 [Mycena floridula]